MQEDNSQPKTPPVTLDDLDRAPETIVPSDSDVSVTTRQYSDRLARVGMDFDNLKAQVDADRARILTELIKPSADRAFMFMWFYCGSVLVLLLLHGFKFCKFNLPESALDFLVGSTAVTVIGLVGMVLTGIFLGVRK